MKKVLFPFVLPKEVKDAYKDKLEIISPEKGPFSPTEMAKYLAEVNAIVAFTNKQMIDSAPKLEFLCSFGAGYDSIDYVYAGEKGIPVSNAAHATTQPTAELTIAIMLCLSRRILNYNRFMKAQDKCAAGAGAFAPPIDNAQSATPVHGKVLGIVGLGKIGKAVAEKAKGLGMSVVYNDVFKASADVEKAYGVKYVKFEELLKMADYVTVHCPYAPETHHLMDEKAFGLMKPTAYFINAARGKVMDEKALIKAIKEKKIRGAALDVYEDEPIVNTELFEMDEVVLTPHIGTTTYESRCKMALEVLENCYKFFQTGNLDTIVNKQWLKK
jgi:lactate dehydrogenase-like 2-hydroxyacid dehydrogenase